MKKTFILIPVLLIILAVIFVISDKDTKPEKTTEQNLEIKDEQSPFEICMAKGGEDITADYNAPKKCLVDNRIYEDLCVENDEYFVVAKTVNDPDIADFIVKKKKDAGQSFKCEYVFDPGDFEIKELGRTALIALEEEFLIFDTAPGPGRGSLAIYDLLKSEKVYEGSYAGSVEIKNKIMRFWDITDIEATEENCYDALQEIPYGIVVEMHKTLNLITMNLIESFEYRCIYRQ